MINKKREERLIERVQRGGGGGGVFFLQAEDGIRDTSVTGVQTCALPIYQVKKRRPSLSKKPGL